MKKQFFAAALALCILFGACGEQKQIKLKLPVGDKIEDIPSYVIEGFKLANTEGAKKTWEFTAKAAQVFELKKKAYAQTVNIKYIQPDGQLTVLTGDRSILNTDTNFMEIDGNVVMTNGEGITMKTEKLFWDDQKKKIFTDAPVTIIRKNSVLKGIGLESDAEMKNMVIKKSVKLRSEDIEQQQ